ncbi:MAG: translocation/assembly module TamB domain-containing protein [Verrucomicrobiota bacterium]
MSKRQRKVLRVGGFFLLALLLLILALPLWFHWMLKPVLNNYGVHYSSYERLSFTRFVLNDVEYKQGKVTFAAHRVETLFPGTFLWRNFNDDLKKNYLRVSGWTLEIIPTDQKSPGTNSAYAASEKVDAVLAEVNRWIPRATFNNGLIRFNKKEISIPATDWNNGNLSGRMVSTNLFPEIFFNTHLKSRLPQEVLLEIPAWNLGGEIVTTRKPSGILQVQGGALWQSNHIDLAAQFGRDGLLPESASIQAKAFRIPSQTVKLEGYGDLTGTLSLLWQSNGFVLDLNAQAQPVNEEIFLSPITADIHATGNMESFVVETANLTLPWLEARLSKNVRFDFQGKLLSETAAINVITDLSKQKWIKATGVLTGEAQLRRNEKRFPDATFALAGSEIGLSEVPIKQLHLNGNLEWPWFRVDSAKVQLADGATAEANLKFNAVTRVIADGNLKLNGQLGQNILPPEISYRTISLTGTFAGPIKKLSHSAHMELQEVQFPKLKPLQIIADWRATVGNFANVEARISSLDSSLLISGAGNVFTNQADFTVEKLSLKNGVQLTLGLENEFSVSAKRTSDKKGAWAIQINPVHLRGEKAELSGEANIFWPARGNVSVAARGLSAVQLRNFFVETIPDATLEKLNLDAHWTNGPVTFGFHALARFASEEGTPLSAELRATGNENGLSIERAEAGSSSESFISGKGFLPITIHPNGSNLVEILQKQIIDFRAETIPNAPFWKQVAAWTQADFREPRLSLSISGTLDSPTGKITASANEILLKRKEITQPIPYFENLYVDFDLNRDRILLSRFELFVEGQPVTASGELPLPKNLKADWKTVFDWRKANARLRIVDAQVAPFGRLFPKILSPLGTVNLDVSITPGGNLNGELRLQNAALRPIQPIGPVHDVQARVLFLNERVTVQSFQASIGGETVNLTGEMNLAKRGMTNDLPEFHFKLRGTNVPLARQPEFIVRSDLNLECSHKPGAPPLISGELNLKDSFYLSELKRLLPGKIARPKQRPPYFSVEEQPFAQWRLNVAVRGTEFLTVRGPLFRGKISSNLKLEGTLKEPLATGDARINSGVIQFPFANLRVDRGFASLSSDNPYGPQLSVSASSRAFGYDVKMDLSGPAEKPLIEFSSTPGLTSEQILLMITAGELPRDEINFTAQQKAGRLAFFLGRNLFSKFGSNGGNADKLEIRSGENVSAQGRQTYYLEYKLSEDWSIVGEYDRFGGLNAGLKWRFFSK